MSLRTRWMQSLLLMCACALVLGACAQKESVQAQAQRLKTSSPGWPKMVAALGAGSSQMKRVDRFATGAVGGRAMLLAIANPVERERALAAWDKDVTRALSSVAQPEHHAVIQQMLSGVASEAAR